ncbi:MAG: hypothetical protein JWP34_5216 [Massilia sp.]|nr:hypothetical protein [Massilia sp.]
MPDEPGLGEVVRRLERLETLLLSLRVVSEDLYNRDQRETERRFTELERDLADERQARQVADRELKEQFTAATTTSGSNMRQAIFSGLIPGVLFLISILITLSQSRGK